MTVDKRTRQKPCSPGDLKAKPHYRKRHNATERVRGRVRYGSSGPTAQGAKIKLTEDRIEGLEYPAGRTFSFSTASSGVSASASQLVLRRARTKENPPNTDMRGRSGAFRLVLARLSRSRRLAPPCRPSWATWREARDPASERKQAALETERKAAASTLAALMGNGRRFISKISGRTTQPRPWRRSGAFSPSISSGPPPASTAPVWSGRSMRSRMRARRRRRPWRLDTARRFTAGRSSAVRSKPTLSRACQLSPSCA